MATHCSKLVANSEICAAQVRDWLPEGLLEVVTNGIDIGRFSPRGHVADPLRLIVAMVGSLTSRWKKHELFVDAALAVDRKLPIEWRIYGHDPSHGDPNHSDHYSAQLHERIAKAGMTDRFVFPGYIADPADIMAQIDLLVHPADHESFGRVAVEAMAAGLPVVGVRGGGVAEIVEHGVTGLLASPDDARGLAACIEQLARGPLRRQAMGAAGRRRAEAQYSIAACTEGILRVYELAMARSLSPSGQEAQAIA
jgi:glycosyltransferase involved in cell wall biosynthesis